MAKKINFSGPRMPKKIQEGPTPLHKDIKYQLFLNTGQDFFFIERDTIFSFLDHLRRSDPPVSHGILVVKAFQLQPLLVEIDHNDFNNFKL